MPAKGCYRTLKQRLLAKTTIPGNKSDCWEWQGNKDKDGYGRIRDEPSNSSKMLRTSAASYSVFVAPVPQNLFVLHTCDNPSCVNPKHLFLGTAKDNHTDMMNKGRHAPGYDVKPERRARGDRHGSVTKPESVTKGESHCRAKLTEQNVITARNERNAYGTTYEKLAARYGVTIAAIRFAVTGKTWKHVK